MLAHKINQHPPFSLAEQNRLLLWNANPCGQDKERRRRRVVLIYSLGHHVFRCHFPVKLGLWPYVGSGTFSVSRPFFSTQKEASCVIIELEGIPRVIELQPPMK